MLCMSTVSTVSTPWCQFPSRWTDELCEDDSCTLAADNVVRESGLAKPYVPS
jgi:hypothetical protein